MSPHPWEVPLRMPVRATVVLIALLASGLIAACGDDSDEPSGSPEAPATASEETQAAAGAAIDTGALEDCLLTSALDRGIYEKVRDISPIVADAASSAGAELFELSKADEGLVYYFAFPDAAMAEEGLATVEGALGDLQSELAAGAPKSITLGAPEVDAVDSLVVGSISFDEPQATQLQADALADLANCLDEMASA